MKINGTEIRKELYESKYVLKELIEEEKIEMVQEIKVKEEGEIKENKKIKEEAEVKRELKHTLYKVRNRLNLYKLILENDVVVEEFKVLLNKEKQQKLAKDVNLAKRLIVAAGDVIEGRYWKGKDMERKDQQKAITELVIENNNMQLLRDISRAKRIWRTIRINKKGQLAGIEKQWKGIRKQLTVLAVVIGAALQKEKGEKKKVINFNKTRVQVKKKKDAKGKTIKELKRTVEEKKKQQKKAQKEAKTLLI